MPDITAIPGFVPFTVHRSPFTVHRFLLFRFAGTLAPFFLASESPIAMACFRLVTLPPFPPLPERSVPFFLRRMALSTRFEAAVP